MERWCQSGLSDSVVAPAQDDRCLFAVDSPYQEIWPWKLRRPLGVKQQQQYKAYGTVGAGYVQNFRQINATKLDDELRSTRLIDMAW